MKKYTSLPTAGWGQTFAQRLQWLSGGCGPDRLPTGPRPGGQTEAGVEARDALEGGDVPPV